jgi:hypothetical protein
MQPFLGYPKYFPIRSTAVGTVGRDVTASEQLKIYGESKIRASVGKFKT